MRALLRAPQQVCLAGCRGFGRSHVSLRHFIPLGTHRPVSVPLSLSVGSELGLGCLLALSRIWDLSGARDVVPVDTCLDTWAGQLVLGQTHTPGYNQCELQDFPVATGGD